LRSRETTHFAPVSRSNRGAIPCAALALWFCYFKPRRQRDAMLASEAKVPPSASVGVRVADQFDAVAVKEPKTSDQVRQLLMQPNADHSSSVCFTTGVHM
jgi:hypothetical protein